MHHTLRFTSSPRLRRWSLPLAALLLLLPALLAACATENTSTETVIVTAAPEEAPREVIVYEELAQREEDMDLMERELALQAERLQMKMVRERQRLLEETSGKKLQRLELEMAYLKDQIKKAAGVAERMEQADREGKSEVTQYEYMMVRRRVELLNGMYMQRMEQFETMKMEQFTEAALGQREREG